MRRRLLPLLPRQRRQQDVLPEQRGLLLNHGHPSERGHVAGSGVDAIKRFFFFRHR